MAEQVIDTATFMAYVLGEPVGDAVLAAARAGDTLHISTVTSGEIVTSLLVKGFEPREIQQILALLDLQVHDYTSDLVQETGLAVMRVPGLSFSQAVAVGLAAKLGVPLMGGCAAPAEHLAGAVVETVEVRAVVKEAVAKPALAETPVAFKEHELDGLDFAQELERATAALNAGKPG
ncbi:MAG: hypothetical protein H7Y60_12355 [Rhodospirillaceae bacterium]|nr:hypothetical protein [Rhodospirillales bacterium]